MLKEKFLSPDITTKERESIMLSQIKKAIECIDLSFDQSIKDQIKQKYENNNNFALIIGANHQSHADIFPLILIADELKKELNTKGQESKFNGLNIIIAFSLTTGHQNQDLKDYYKIVKEICSPKDIEFITMVRPKDKEKYGITANALNIRSIKKARKSYKDGCVLVEFPESTVKGGRINLETGLPFGPQKPNEHNMIDYCIKKYSEKEIEFGVLPIAIGCTYKIYPPDTYKFNLPEEKIKTTVCNLLSSNNFSKLKQSIRPSDLIMQKIKEKL
jgi:1-acyl-sn-glycerol-3-phosphate acyltransferase